MSFADLCNIGFAADIFCCPGLVSYQRKNYSRDTPFKLEENLDNKLLDKTRQLKQIQFIRVPE